MSCSLRSVSSDTKATRADSMKVLENGMPSIVSHNMPYQNPKHNAQLKISKESTLNSSSMYLTGFAFSSTAELTPTLTDKSSIVTNCDNTIF